MDGAMRKLILFVVLSIMSGCGERAAPTAHLAGAVTLSGKPIPADAEAALSFEPLGGGKSVSAPITNGRYDSPQTPLGAVLVKFYISRRTGPVKISERTGKEFQEIANLVPPARAAGMNIEVSEENLSQDFEL
jgi:hypothetical protein